jgi:hypothetical protein
MALENHDIGEQTAAPDISTSASLQGSHFSPAVYAIASRMGKGKTTKVAPILQATLDISANSSEVSVHEQS